MIIELRLAWRNVWRNRRRTGLTIAATVFAVVLVVFLVAMAAGLHEKMIEDSVRLASGHVALSAPEYLEKGGLEHFIVLDQKLETVLAETPGICGVALRIVSFGLPPGPFVRTVSRARFGGSRVITSADNTTASASATICHPRSGPTVWPCTTGRGRVPASSRPFATTPSTGSNSPWGASSSWVRACRSTATWSRWDT